MKLDWSDHNGKRATVEHKDVFYEAAFHYGMKLFFCEAQTNGKRLFTEYADTLEEAKEIAEAHAFDFDEALKDL